MAACIKDSPIKELATHFLQCNGWEMAGQEG